MSTRQAEEVLEHTFRQLEQMVKDVRRQKTGCSPRGAIREEKMGRKKEAVVPGNRKNDDFSG